jgi:hypothetical protein
MKSKSFWILTGSLVLVKLAIHFLTCTNYELHRDEMLYFSMGSHLSWGFASTPPMMSFLSFLVKNLFGYHEFFVKLLPALAGGAILVLTSLFIRALGGRGFAILSGGLAYIISIAMLRTSSLFMPVIFELFFWMLFLYLILLLIQSRNTKYWVAIGICFGLAFLNKYSVVFLGLATFLAILFSSHRKLLWSKHLLVGILAGLLVMMPNIAWQVSHKFPVLTHMSELYRTQLVHVSMTTFLLEQIMMNFTCLLIWLTGLVILLTVRAERPYRVFAVIFLVVVLLFLVTRGKSYYTLGVYPVMIAFGGFYLEKYFQGKARLAGYAILAWSVLTSLLLIPLGLPLLPQKQMANYCRFLSDHITRSPMRNEQNGYYPLPQDYMDMTGWKQLAGLAAMAYDKLDSQQKKDCILFANNYGQAGALDFYGKNYHLPTPICLSDSYVFWAPDSLEAKNYIITDHQPGQIPVLFDRFSEIGVINNYYFRENGLKVYLCQDPKPGFYEFVRSEIRKRKEVYE